MLPIPNFGITCLLLLADTTQLGPNICLSLSPVNRFLARPTIPQNKGCFLAPFVSLWPHSVYGSFWEPSLQGGQAFVYSAAQNVACWCSPSLF